MKTYILKPIFIFILMGVVLSTGFFLTGARNQDINSEMNGDISSDTPGEKKMKTNLVNSKPRHWGEDTSVYGGGI